jgi:hypothetical protein
MKLETIKKAINYKKQHLHLTHWLLNKECSVSVFVDGEIELEKSTNYEKIKEYLECADEVQINIYNKYNNKIAWALIIPFNEDDCTVSDYSATAFMGDWANQFDVLTEQLQTA